MSIALLVMTVLCMVFATMFAMAMRGWSAAQRNCDKAIKGWNKTIDDWLESIHQLNEALKR